MAKAATRRSIKWMRSRFARAFQVFQYTSGTAVDETVPEAIANMVVKKTALRKGILERGVSLGRYVFIIVPSTGRHEPYR